MHYLSSYEAAIRKGVTNRRIQQMCKEGEISGAVKKGRAWFIPEDDLSDVYARPISENKKKLPVGISDFKIASTEYYYVDKTLMIRDFLDSKPQVSLFTRPRRFGKTLNMDMLRAFFEKSDDDTSKYFENLAIWQCGDRYISEQGKYPVIFLTFKDVKNTSWQDTLYQLRQLIALEYQRHAELGSSIKLNDFEKRKYLQLANADGENVDFHMALLYLSQMLKKHYGEKVIIIIDEYDTPVQQGYVYGFYENIINFMRNFFSGGLKDNPCLAYGFMTGILRVAKESIFSGLNNIKINSLLDSNYSRYFGFTMDEVRNMLKYYGAEEKFEEVCEWYDGYRFGNTEILNPWSVINYIDNGCVPKAFWQSTGNNDFIKEIIENASAETIENLYTLFMESSVTTYVDTGIIYPEVKENPYSVFSFLVIAGYLKVSEIYPQFDGNYMCEVKIPNKEIRYVFEKEILNRSNSGSVAISVSQAVFSADAEKLQMILENFMINTISYYDGANESFYHGMMLGLCAVMGNQYRILSNRESGIGRFDVMLIPKNRKMPGFIFEFKHTKEENINLEDLAEQALLQIDEKRYETELEANDVSSIIKIGIAFRGKNAAVKK